MAQGFGLPGLSGELLADPAWKRAHWRRSLRVRTLVALVQGFSLSTAGIE